jgi:hypothetical protein
MTLFLGFDRSQYPGDAMMQSLRTQAGLAWTGFYLAPAPSHGDGGWMQKRALLQSFGYGFAPVYLGQQQGGPGSHKLSAQQGTLDGQNAAQLAAQAGFPQQSVVYLDIETGPPLQSAFLDYYAAWTQSVVANDYTPGVYCSYLLAAQLQARDARPVFWVFRLKFPMSATITAPVAPPDPTQSGFSDATLLQFAQNVTLRLPNGTQITPVDLDSSTSADPSRLPVASVALAESEDEPVVQPS